MTHPENVNPYDARSVRRHSYNRRIDIARRDYIDRKMERLKFTSGQDHLNPYDLTQVARIRDIFRKSREIYRR